MDRRVSAGVLYPKYRGVYAVGRPDRRRDFPDLETDVHVPGTPPWIEVDVFFPDHNLAIEVDGARGTRRSSGASSTRTSRR